MIEQQLIHKYLPEYSYNEYHKKLVNASKKHCFQVTQNLDMGKSIVIRTLMKIRNLPVSDLTLRGFIKNICFTYPGEDPWTEFVIDASRNNLRIMWNFYFKENAKNSTIISTETRILCLTKRSKILFSVYWFFVKPFSSLIRIEMLRLIRKNAEKLRTN